MSTMTSAETAARRPVPAAAIRPPRLITPTLALVFATSLGTLTSFYLLLSVTPTLVAAAGAGGAGAGLATGTLMLSGVAAEFAAPALIARLGNRAVLALGAVLLGGPALVLLARGGMAAIIAVCVVRGLGFGLTVVVTGALTAELVPAERRGEGAGISGVVSCVPAVVALPAGVWLAGQLGPAPVIVITAAAALAPLAGMLWLPGRARHPAAAGSAPGGSATGAPAAGAEGPAGLLAALRQPALRRPALTFAAVTVPAGVVVAFLPLAAGAPGGTAAAALFAEALAATVTRWWAGRRGDRRGHARLLVPGLVTAAAGMTLLAASAAPVAAIAGMIVFGAGFGVIQNATFALLMSRVPAGSLGTASALWNLAYDAGYGAGPAILGLVVGSTGYAAGFALTAVLILTALRPARRERRG
ncbi:MAG TPA: MFS transporter [Streptosporangiaceae bacterium]